MTKQKGPKRAKTTFTVLRIQRKATRHLKGEALAAALKKFESLKKAPAPAKA